MPTKKRLLKVFLCHASQDKSVVRELYQRLLAEGWIDPWLDEEKLLPGQDWDLEIEKAVESTDAVIVCISTNSISKEGFVQREIRLALSVALEKPEETIFMIPLRLDDCLLPRSLRSIQYINYFPDEYKETSIQRILVSLQMRAKSLGIQLEVTIKKSSAGNAKKSDGKFKSDYSVIQEFRIRSGDFFGKPLRMRQAAADDVRRLSVELELDDILQFAISVIPGERVAGSIALGEKIRTDQTYSQDTQVRNALLGLLSDSESRVRFRALESISSTKSLIQYFRNRIEQAAYDENKSIKELAESLLR